MTAWSPRNATIATDIGRVDLLAPFHHPAKAVWTPMSADPDLGGPGEPQEILADVPGTGYMHEAREVVRCLRAGETESPLVPLDESVALMRLMDRIRDQIGRALRLRVTRRRQPQVGEHGQHASVGRLVGEQAELAEDPLGVLLHRPRRDHHRLGDRRVGLALRHQGQHLGLARRETGEGVAGCVASAG